MPDKPAKKTKRVSMQGMGADAFFGPPVEKLEEEEKQEAKKTVHHSPVIPAKQHDDTLTLQQDSSPASQEAIVPTKQERAMPVISSTTLPVSQQNSTPDKQDFIKATYYIRPEQDIALERIRLQRRLKGEKVDKSALVREMLDRFAKEEENN